MGNKKPKYIICTVGTSIANGCPEQKELFKTYAEWDAENHKIIEELNDKIKAQCPNITANTDSFRHLSAELNTLDRLNLEKNDRIALISSDNLLGNICSTKLKGLICEAYSLPESHVQIHQIHDLQLQDTEKLRKCGLKNLVSTVLNILNDEHISYTHKIIFNPVGGYKFIVPFMNILAMLYGKESVYLFEYSNNLLKIPALPFSFDLEIFRRVKPALELVEEKTEVTKEEFFSKIIDYTNSEENLFLSFTEPTENNKITLSPLAFVFQKINKPSHNIKINDKSLKILKSIEGTGNEISIRRMLKNVQNPVWRKDHVHTWKSTDLKAIKCRSIERIACYIEKDIIKIVNIFTDHHEYERVMPTIKKDDFKNDYFNDYIESDEDYGVDDDNVEAVCGERDNLQALNKKLKEEIQALKEQLKDMDTSNQDDELNESIISELHEKCAKHENEINSLQEQNSSYKKEIDELKDKIQYFEGYVKKDKKFINMLKNLFRKGF